MLKVWPFREKHLFISVCALIKDSGCSLWKLNLRIFWDFWRDVFFKQVLYSFITSFCFTTDDIDALLILEQVAVPLILQAGWITLYFLRNCMTNDFIIRLGNIISGSVWQVRVLDQVVGVRNWSSKKKH